MMMTMIWCWWWQWHERKDDSKRFSAAGSFFVRTHAQSAERRCLSDFSNGCVTHCAELHYTLYSTNHRRWLRKSRLPRNSCKAWLCIFIYIIMRCRIYIYWVVLTLAALVMKLNNIFVFPWGVSSKLGVMLRESPFLPRFFILKIHNFQIFKKLQKIDEVV